MSFWRNRRVVVTGGHGFLGSHVVERLRAAGAEPVAPRSAACDLTDQAATARLMHDVRPDLVMHLAARVGGIGANRANPAVYFYDNLLMGVHVIEQARRAGVEKVLVAGTVCAYPKFTPVPFREEDLWSGYPEETNAPYGIAKKVLLVQAQAYRQQYGLNCIYLLPVNLYGPRDNFDPETSHVIPALIRRFCEAVDDGRTSVDVWGTGAATREFLYVEDCADALLLAAERYDGAAPVNIGSGREVSIRELTARIAALAGYSGQILWDATKPDGQPRRLLDTSRASAAFGFTASTTLEEGLARTVEFYRRGQGRD